MKNHPPYPVRKGQGLLEYAVLIVLVVAAVILILYVSGVNLRDLYCSITGKLGGQACQAYCQDGFASLSEWTMRSNTGWNVVDGRLCNTGKYEQQVFSSCASKQKLPEKYEIKIDLAELSAGDGYGVFFRMQSTSPANGYVFQYDPGLGGAFVVRKWVNGWEVNPPLARVVPKNYTWLNQERDIRLEVDGFTTTAYVDGEKVLSFTDSTYPAGGGSGFRTWDSTQACFDDFTIVPAR